jgi:rod shape-determining protein MreB
VPPELCGDIHERGVVLTGGVAFLRKLDEHLHKGTGLPVVKAGEPLATVVIGAGRLLSDRALLSKVAVN